MGEFAVKSAEPLVPPSTHTVTNCVAEAGLEVMVGVGAAFIKALTLLEGADKQPFAAFVLIVYTSVETVGAVKTVGVAGALLTNKVPFLYQLLLIPVEVGVIVIEVP